MDLNKQQKEAVENTEGYELVLAGAGSGKTRVLTQRYLYLIKHGRLSNKILAITFTRKAADEMRDRIREEYPDFDGRWICTFHGFCKRLLDEDGNAINVTTVNIHTESKAKRDIRKAVEITGHTAKDITVEAAKFYIHQCKSDTFYEDYLKAKTDPTLEYLHKMADAKYCKWVDNMFWEYMRIQGEDNLYDFDDLIILGYYLLDTNEEICLKWQKQFEYIMVDEYQDVSLRQKLLMDKLAEWYENLMVVGDANQCIYGFRGADPMYILNFDEEHPDCKKIEMNKNYRSFQSICDAANELIQYNPDRSGINLEAIREGGEKPKYFHALNGKKEKLWISNRIKELAGDYDYQDIAVLCRRNETVQKIQAFLSDENVPAVIMTNEKFYDLQIIKEAVGYLRMVYDPNDNEAFDLTINVPPRSLGKKTLAPLKRYAEEHEISYYEALKRVIDNGDIKMPAKAAGYQLLIEDYHKKYKEFIDPFSLAIHIWQDSNFDKKDRKGIDSEDNQNIGTLKSIIKDFVNIGEPRTLKELLDYFKEHIDDDEAGNRVRVGTIHSAKGLEWPVVFLADFVDGSLPSSKAEGPFGIYEERRLCYVAITRARDKLFITDANLNKKPNPSRFLSEFGFPAEESTVQHLVPLPDGVLKKPRPPVHPDEPVEIFPVGTRVVSELDGEGTVTGIAKSTYTIEFDRYPGKPRERTLTSVEKVFYEDEQ